MSGKKITQTTTQKLRNPIPFLLAAVSICDIQALTENRFAKKGAEKKNQEIDRKAVKQGKT